MHPYPQHPHNFKIQPQSLIQLHKSPNTHTPPPFFQPTPPYHQQIFPQQQSKNSPYHFSPLLLDYHHHTKIPTIQQTNHFKPPQQIQFFPPQIQTFKQLLHTIYDQQPNHLHPTHHPLQILQIKLHPPIYPNNFITNQIP
ncbi:U32 family peptidase C-terminal domain-containing protein [Staphylococcus pasteuri]|uniref:U32 family peptidase C-terminal domain-containing protein n=1 Tax=Staphylococcus pasteuri TaxID=45972 RepID=UPI0036F2D43D